MILLYSAKKPAGSEKKENKRKNLLRNWKKKKNLKFWIFQFMCHNDRGSGSNLAFPWAVLDWWIDICWIFRQWWDIFQLWIGLQEMATIFHSCKSLEKTTILQNCKSWKLSEILTCQISRVDQYWFIDNFRRTECIISIFGFQIFEEI